MINKFNIPIGKHLILEDDFTLNELDTNLGTSLERYIPGTVRVGQHSWSLPKGLIITIKSIKVTGVTDEMKVNFPKSKQRSIPITASYIGCVIYSSSLNGMKYSEI